MKHIGPYEARKMVRAARDNSDYFIYAVFCLIYVEVFVAPTED